MSIAPGNGIWRSIAVALGTMFARAVTWNFAQLDQLEKDVARLGNPLTEIRELRDSQSVQDKQISILLTNQQAVMRRLDHLEDLVNTINARRAKEQ